MKPFLIIQFRANKLAADNELEAILKWGRLNKNDIELLKATNGIYPKIDLNLYSGIILGGSPFNISDPLSVKTKIQQDSESFTFELMQEVMEKDFPCLGICYGMGVLGQCCKSQISTEKYGEEIGAVKIALTKEGRLDPITKGIPNEFTAIVGHKEACQSVPDKTVLLASSDTCPVQLLRYKNNIYATQFHPELDDDGIKVRAEVYKNAGYFPAEEVQKIIDTTSGYDLSNAVKILQNFISLAKKN